MISLKSILVSALCLGVFSSQAQISDGGFPVSFQHQNISAISQQIPVSTMPAVDEAKLKAEDAINDQYKDVPYRFGFNHSVDLHPGNSGIVEYLPDGGRIWRLEVYSPGALSLNFEFGHYDLPDGAQLFIHNPDVSEILGAFTSKNNKAHGELGVTLLQGDRAIINYYEPAGVVGEGKIQLKQVTHGYRSVLNYAKGLGDSGNCNNNVICPEGDDWRDQIRSVAIIVVSGNGICTGALVNSTCEDGTPYFLTADHCVGFSVSNWVFRFNWDSPECSQNLNGPTNQSVSGATLRASNSGSDVALLEMSSVPPASYEVFYAGWDNSGTAPTETVAIHHPAGDVKKISFDEDPATTTQWSGAATWHIADWEDGTTEPGSSGSPLFDQNGLVIGQLYGGTANCSNNIDDYYGRFDVSWDAGGSSTNQLKDWLDNCNTNPVTIDGYDPNAPVLALDAEITSIANLPEITCDDEAQPVITIKNQGIDPITSLTINYYFDPAQVQTINWTGNLLSGNSIPYNLPVLSLPPGSQNLTVELVNPNGSADMDPTNNTRDQDVKVWSNGQDVQLVINPDFFASQMSWEIVADNNNQVIYSDGGYTNGTSQIIEFLCLDPGCYQFKIYDSQGNGLANSSQTGNYYITDINGDTLITELGNSFTFQKDSPFCLDGEPSNVKEIELKAFSVFPNPTRDQLVISREGNEMIQIRLLNLAGQVVMNAQSAQNRIELDLSSQSKGMYFLELTVGDQRSVRKVVKQ